MPPQNAMRIVHVGESLTSTFGGTAVALAGLARHQARAGHRVTCITVDGGARRASAARLEMDGKVTVKYLQTVPPHRIGLAPGLGAALRSAEADVIHVHGLWRLHLVQAVRVASSHAVPCVVSTHGMLHRVALAQGASAKRLARWIFQDRVLRSASCLHATADAEAAEIRAAGFTNPIAVVPWGVDLPDLPEATRRIVNRSRREVLFVGRIHPSKGLDVLLRAWKDAAAGRQDVRLVVAGGGDARYLGELQALAAALGVADAVAWRGPVTVPERDTLLRDASLVVLPSAAENFGFVVPEALAHAVPVIATRGAPWQLLEQERCGWWVEAAVSPIATAIREALSLPSDALLAMGARGRAAVAERFAWPRAADALVDVYAWLAGGRAEPQAAIRRVPVLT